MHEREQFRDRLKAMTDADLVATCLPVFRLLKRSHGCNRELLWQWAYCLDEWKDRGQPNAWEAIVRTVLDERRAERMPWE